MKTTIDIADDIFERVQRLAEKQNTTLRALTEEALRSLLERRQAQAKVMPDLVTFGGEGRREEFADGSWAQIRDELYRGRGA
jgi:predicted transcriptional regulator